jgi:hypothetical protein
MLQAVRNKFFALKAAEVKAAEVKAAEVKAAEERNLTVRAPRLSACPA